MYAIVEIAGKQYKVEKGTEILVDLLESKEGQKIKFNTVTLYRTDKDIVVGKPYVEKATIESKVMEPLVKGKKLTVYKYKAKTSQRRKNGHREKYTRLQITGISMGTEKAAKAESAGEPQA